MANVLPQKERKLLRQNYWLRFGTTFALTIAIAMVVGIISLVPSYLSARTDLTEIVRYQELQNKTREAAKDDMALEITRIVNAQIQESLQQDAVRASQAITYIMRDWEIHSQDIIISGFTYNQSASKDASTQMRVSGEARDRGALNKFIQTLRADPTFKNVSFPISDLAGDAIITFSITLELK